MLRKIGHLVFIFLPLSLAFVLAGCGASHPSNDEILNHLNGSLDISQPYQFTSVQPDFYPQGDGSVTIKGNLTGKLKGDLYERADYQERLKELGYDDAAWKNAVHDAQLLREPYRSTLMAQLPADVQNHPELLLIKMATPAGGEAHFNFQTTATKGSNGWSLGEDQIVPSDHLGGMARSRFGDDALVVGSDQEKAKNQAYVDQTQTFIKAVADAQKSIVAEDQKVRNALLAATAGGKTYVGTYNWNNGSWPIGLTLTDQQQIGTGVSLKGYLFDPENPTHRKDLVGHIEFDPNRAQGQPIRFTAVHATGIDLSTIRRDNGTDRQLNSGFYNDFGLNLALDGQGNLSGFDQGGQANLAPKP